MPPNARKGHVFQKKITKKGGSSQKRKKTTSVAKKITAVEGTRCRILELPAEIRNRIYHFTEEQTYDDDDDTAPSLLVHKKLAPTTVIASSSRLDSLGYRALTQVCKQIRTEYRPIWLRQLCFRMELSVFAQFVRTYYPKVTDYQNAPRILLISWDHGTIRGELGDNSDAGWSVDYDEDSIEHVLTDISLLIRLRAHCPTFTAKFVSTRVLEDDVRNVRCDDCGHSIHCGCDGDCDHDDAWDEAYLRMEESFLYLRGLNNFLANSNEKWLKLFRDTARVNPLVKFTFDFYTQRPTLYIRFSQGEAPKGFQLKSMYSYALAFLKRSGILDLNLHRQLDFVIGEATGKYAYNDGGNDADGVIYNQIHLDGATIARWKQEKETKTAS